MKPKTFSGVSIRIMLYFTFFVLLQLTGYKHPQTKACQNGLFCQNLAYLSAVLSKVVVIQFVPTFFHEA